MTFSTRTYDEIVAQLLTAFASAGTDVTDLQEGSVISTILESVAIVAQQIEEDLAARLDADITTSAYRSFNFSLLAEQSATGSINVFPESLTHPRITFPVGTSFSVPGTNLRFISQNEVVMEENTAGISLLVTAQTPGTISNVPANTVTRLDSGIAGVGLVTNSYPFVNGKDAEDDSGRRLRFQHWITMLHYGTSNAIEAGVGQVSTLNAFGVPQEKVGRVKIDESDANLKIYITNDSVLGASSPNYPFAASSDLIAAVLEAVDGKIENGVRTPGYKAAGVKSSIEAAIIKPVSINLFVKAINGYSMLLVIPTLESTIQTLFNQLNIGESLSLQNLRKVILSTRGVENFVLSVPTINVEAKTNEIITLIPFVDVTNNPPITLDLTRSWIQRL